MRILNNIFINNDCGYIVVVEDWFLKNEIFFNIEKIKSNSNLNNIKNYEYFKNNLFGNIEINIFNLYHISKKYSNDNFKNLLIEFVAEFKKNPNLKITHDLLLNLLSYIEKIENNA